MYKKIVNIDDKEVLINRYFVLISGQLGNMLDNFLLKEGFGLEDMRILFKNDFEEWEDEYQEMCDDNVMLLAEYPAVDEDCKVLLMFDELCRIVESKINESATHEQQKLNMKLGNVKNNFNI